MRQNAIDDSAFHLETDGSRGYLVPDLPVQIRSSRRQVPGHDGKCRAYPSRQEVSEPTSSKVFVLRKVSTSCCIAATDRDFICHRAPPTLTCNWWPRGSCQSCIESLSYLYIRLEYSYLPKLGFHHHWSLSLSSLESAFSCAGCLFRRSEPLRFLFILVMAMPGSCSIVSSSSPSECESELSCGTSESISTMSLLSKSVGALC